MNNVFSQVQLERLNDGKLNLSWQGTNPSGRVEIYWSSSNDQICKQGYKLIEVLGDSESVIFDDPNPERRSYYQLKSENGATRTVAERKLPFEGLANFRDLGGYETADGRCIKWGLVYRSEQLSHLTESDYAYLQHCGLKLICDYRADNESYLLPNPELTTVRCVRIPITTTDTLEPGERLIHANKNYVANCSREFSRMMELLQAADSLPALQHCIVGKDRTGFGSAVLLLALGVPEQTVMEDYLLTNKFKAGLYKKFRAASQPNAGKNNDADGLLELLESRPEYLQAAFDEIHNLYGSFDEYLEKGLGLTHAKRKQLQDLLLTEE